MTLNLPKTAVKMYISEWQKNVHFGTAVQLYVTNGYNTNVFCKATNSMCSCNCKVFILYNCTKMRKGAVKESCNY